MQGVVDSLGDAIDPWGYVLLFVLALCEAAAFVGLFVPGEVALLFAGVLASEGKVSLAVVIVCAVAGSIIGDSIGYQMGRQVLPWMRRSALGRKVGEANWEKARVYVCGHGGRAVFFGRFVGFLRALVPAIVGDARMPYYKFLFWSVLGTLCSTPLVVLAGYVAGSSYETVESSFTYASWVLGGLILAVVGVKLLRRRRPAAAVVDLSGPVAERDAEHTPAPPWPVPD